MYNLQPGPKGAFPCFFSICIVDFRLLFQEAALLLSMMAASLKRESGENVEEGSLASEVEKMVVDHLVRK